MAGLVGAGSLQRGFEAMDALEKGIPLAAHFLPASHCGSARDLGCASRSGATSSLSHIFACICALYCTSRTRSRSQISLSCRSGDESVPPAGPHVWVVPPNGVAPVKESGDSNTGGAKAHPRHRRGEQQLYQH